MQQVTGRRFPSASNHGKHRASAVFVGKKIVVRCEDCGNAAARELEHGMTLGTCWQARAFIGLGPSGAALAEKIRRPLNLDSSELPTHR